ARYGGITTWARARATRILSAANVRSASSIFGPPVLLRARRPRGQSGCALDIAALAGAGWSNRIKRAGLLVLPTRGVRRFGSWSSSFEEAPGRVDVRAAGERCDCG